jgi:UDP-glucose 4-epimerase
LLRVTGSTLDVEHGPGRTVNAVRRRLADTRNASRELGFDAIVGLDEGLRRLVEWRQGQREVASNG